MRKFIIAGVLGTVALLSTACGRSIDVEQVGAKAVPGARGLYYFCHGPTLIYVSHWDSSPDEYEAMWPGWCNKGSDGKWFYDTETALLPPAKTDGNTEDDK